MHFTFLAVALLIVAIEGNTFFSYILDGREVVAPKPPMRSPQISPQPSSQTSPETSNVILGWSTELYKNLEGEEKADQILDDTIKTINQFATTGVQIEKVHLKFINQAQLIGVPTYLAQGTMNRLKDNPDVRFVELDRQLTIF